MPRRKNAAKRQSAQPRAGRGRHVAVSVDARQASLAVLAAETDRQLQDLIARRLALPVDKRMNFLRRRLPGGGSCL
ncbi:MAG: hypothetical protein O3A37_09075 [Planctomycetota bacterium]|jgi:hypothetical protein|nr:hypothetical protein [Planctomycetota bacterium]